jgi:ribose 5-phosphate isomerase A
LVAFQVDITVDGADECDKKLICIKGGGGCLLQEKVVAYFSKKMVVAADAR